MIFSGLVENQSFRHSHPLRGDRPALNMVGGPGRRGCGAVTASQTLTVRDHDLPEMAASLEMPMGRLSLGERKCPIDHGAQPMHGDSPVHRLKIRAAPDADRAEGNAAAGQQ
jgi:hypothetical protein